MNGSDVETAQAFADSWNHVGSVYSREQFLEWMQPLDPADFRGREVIELGFGNGSLLRHVLDLAPARVVGVDLGDTIEQTRRNLAGAPLKPELVTGDLTKANLGTFDVAYCIGVLHHLQDPKAGFDAVLRHTKPGGRFHCWVYAHEGNAVVRWFVDPVRRVASKLPWWLTKYAIAMPLVAPYFVWAKLLRAFGLLGERSPLRFVPLFEYTRWIAGESFRFFHHVAFDQLVTPATQYIRRETVDAWLDDPRIDRPSTYVIFRNGNSWKFGGRKK